MKSFAPMRNTAPETRSVRRAGLNWYAYVNDDPTDFVDPLGLAKTDAQASSSFIQRMAAAGESLDLGVASTGAKIDQAIVSPLKSVDPGLYNQATSYIQNQYTITSAAIEKAYYKAVGESPPS